MYFSQYLAISEYYHSIEVHVWDNLHKFTLSEQNLLYGLQKVGCKKQGNCYPKREEAARPPLFLRNNDPYFCNSYLDLFLKVPDPKKI